MQIDIQFVNHAKPGSKYGSIAARDGTRIVVPANLTSLFRAGLCDVPTKVETWYRGTEKEAQVTVATGGPGGNPTGAVGGQQGYQSVHGTPDRNTGQRANTGFQPRVYQGGGGQPAATSDPQGRGIFICGVVQRAMQTGKFTASEILVLTEAAAEAYDRVVSAPPRTYTTPAPRDEPPAPEAGDPGPAELL